MGEMIITDAEEIEMIKSFREIKQEAEKMKRAGRKPMKT